MNRLLSFSHSKINYNKAVLLRSVLSHWCGLYPLLWHMGTMLMCCGTPRFLQFAGAAHGFQLTTLQKSPWKYNRNYITLYCLNKINHSYKLVLDCCVIPLSLSPISATFLQQNTCYSLVAWMIWETRMLNLD